MARRVTMLHCAILDDYQHTALAAADWSPLAGAVAIRTFHHPFTMEDDVVAAIHDCEIVVIMRERTPFPASLFARLPHLRLLVTTGMRNAALDLDAARAHGVVVCGTASASEPAVELTWALILGLARNLVLEANAIRSGGWQSTIGADMQGQTLGVVGLGRIGTRVARVARAFEMRVLAWSQHLTAERADAAGVQLAPSKYALLEQSDVVTIHLVSSERTRGLIGGTELRRMKPTAYLINTSRAAIVNQPALLRALREGWIAGAAVDVFDEEPLPREHVMRTLPNLLATPHLGYVTRANYATFYREAVEDILAFLNDRPIRVLSFVP